MPSNKPSLIAGLDPAALFGLSAEEPGAAGGLWQPPTIEEAAKLFPAWKVLGLLGRGGMGAVYHVHQPDLDRAVAVKLLPIEASRDERQVERFRREARTLAKLKHPGIVALHEAGITPEGHFFFVMEHVGGHPLSSLIAQGKMDVPRAIEIVRQVCDALAYAHGQGVVHRDIKPSNILIDELGQAKVADFGLAHWEHPEKDGALSLSRTGMLLGTPAYAAPEQARDAAHVDHRADIYSLGVLLYEMLTGELPRGVFQPPSRKAGSDQRLDTVVQRALQERPEDRYQAASELKKDVSSVQSDSSPKSVAWLSWTLVGLLIIAAAGIFVWPKVQTALVVTTVEPVQSSREPFTQPTPTTKPKGATAPVHKRTAIVPPPASPTPPDPKSEAAAVSMPPAGGASPVASLSPSPSIVPSPPAAAPAENLPKVWSVNPLSPALSPPNELMQQAWKDCVLVKGGGAVWLEENDVVMRWSEQTPGKATRVSAGEIFGLAQTAESVIYQLRSTWVFDDGVRSVKVIEAPSIIHGLFPSAGSSWLALTTMKGPLGLHFDGREVQTQQFPFHRVAQLAVISKTVAFALDEEEAGTLLALNAAGNFERVTQYAGVRKIVPWAGGVLMITADGRVEAFNVTAPVPPLQNITDIITGGDYAIAIDSASRLTIWSPNEEPMRTKRQGTQIRVSPQGLIAEW